MLDCGRGVRPTSLPATDAVFKGCQASCRILKMLLTGLAAKHYASKQLCFGLCWQPELCP